MAGTDFAIIARLLADPRPFLVAMQMAMSKTAGMGRSAAGRVERSFRRRVSRGINAGAKRAFQAAGAAAATGLAGLAAKGKDLIGFATQLEDVGVQAGLTEGETQELGRAIADASEELGVSQDVLKAGIASWVNLGLAGKDLQGEMRALGEVTRALSSDQDVQAQTVDATVKNWAALNATMFDGKGTAEDMRQTLSAVITAADKGAAPIDQLGTTLADTAGQFAAFSSGGKRGAAELAALIEATAVKGGFSTAAKAATGLQGALTALTTPAKIKKLERLKVRVFERRNGQLQRRTLRQITADVVAAQKRAKEANKDFSGQMQEAVGDVEAMRFFMALTRESVVKDWDEITEAAASSNSVQEKGLRRSESAVGRLNKGMVGMENAVRKAFSGESLEVWISLLNGATGAMEGFLSVGEELGKFAAEVVTGGETVTERARRALRGDQPPEDRTQIDRLREEVTALGMGEVRPEQRRLIEQQFPGVDPEQIARERTRAELQKIGVLGPTGEVVPEQLARLGLDPGILGPEGEVDITRRGAGAVSPAARGLAAVAATRGPTEAQRLDRELQTEIGREGRRQAEFARSGAPAVAAESERIAAALEQLIAQGEEQTSELREQTQQGRSAGRNTREVPGGFPELGSR